MTMTQLQALLQVATEAYRMRDPLALPLAEILLANCATDMQCEMADNIINALLTTV